MQYLATRDQAAVFQGSRKASLGPYLVTAGAYTGEVGEETCWWMRTGWGRNPRQDMKCLGWRACIDVGAQEREVRPCCGVPWSGS